MNILTNSTMVNLSISIWTGKAKLQRTEVDDSALPPEELVTLGSKKLFDPVKLKRFHGIKSNAFAACNKYGVRCMSGWLVANKYIDELADKLAAQRILWDDEVRKFLATYQMECDEWLSANPQWSNILANAMPRQSEIAKRFNFGWQVFNVVPAPTDTAGDQTEDELAIVPTRAIEKMAKEIEDIQEVYAPGKPFKSGPLQRLASMARALSFSSPEVDKLAELLAQIASAGSLDIAQIMLGKLADPKELAVLCDPGKTAQDIVDGVWSQQPAPEPIQEAELPEPMTKPLPDIGSLIANAQNILQKPAPVETLDECVDVEQQPVEEIINGSVQPESAQVEKPKDNNQAMSNMLGAIDSEGLW